MKLRSKKEAVLFSTVSVLFFLSLLVSYSLSAPASTFKWPGTWTIQSASVQTAAYPISAAMGSKLEETTGMKVRVLPGEAGVARIRYLKSGFANESYMSATTVVEALEGLWAFQVRDMGPTQVRGSWVLGSTGVGFMVRGDSRIKTIYDIKPGTKFSELTTVPNFKLLTRALLAWIGVNEKDIIFVPTSSWAKNGEAVMNGEADVCVTASISSTAYQWASNPHGTRWLALDPQKDPKGAERFLAIAPFVPFDPIDDGPKSAVGIPSWNEPGMYYVMRDTDEEVVYNLAKWRAENYNLYKDMHPLMKQETVNFMRKIMDTFFVPVHAGVIRYFKEIGKWSPEDDAWQKKNIDLLNRYGEAYKVAIKRADDRKIKTVPENQEWVKLWEDYKKEIGLPRFRARIKSK
jgi:TRAP transporter TAXI family solute receptor